MAVGVFPALKLGVLFIKQISKPLAKVLVQQAKNHPVFRTYFIIPPAQFYHWAEVKAKMYIMNLGKPTKVAKLNEQMAIELGASLLGEVVIFSVAGGCLILEYNRQAAKETKKEEARMAQVEQFTNDIEGLRTIAHEQEEQILLLKNVVEELAKRSKAKIASLDRLKEAEIKNTKSDEHETSSEKRPSNATDDRAKQDESLVRQAIGYFENDLKGKSLS